MGNGNLFLESCRENSKRIAPHDAHRSHSGSRSGAVLTRAATTASTPSRAPRPPGRPPGAWTTRRRRDGAATAAAPRGSRAAARRRRGAGACHLTSHKTHPLSDLFQHGHGGCVDARLFRPRLLASTAGTVELRCFPPLLNLGALRWRRRCCQSSSRTRRTATTSAWTRTA
jgi:hypothetical protein